MGGHCGVGPNACGRFMDSVSVLCNQQDARAQQETAEAVGGSPHCGFRNTRVGTVLLFDDCFPITSRSVAAN